MTIYKGVAIHKTPFRWWEVKVTAWGDGMGENVASFKTLRAAKAFIDRNQGGLP